MSLLYRTTSSGIAAVRTGPAVIGAGALGALAAGIAIGTGAHMVALAAIALVVVVVLALDDPDWALAAICAIVYANLSDVVAERSGIPSLLRPLIAAGVGLLLLRFALLGERPRWSGAVAAALGFVGVARLLSVLGATYPEVTVAAVADYGRDAALCLLVVAFLATPRSLVVVMWTLIATAGLLAGITVVQQLADLQHQDFFGLGKGAMHQIAGEDNGWRPHGPLDDPNFYGQLLLIALPLAIERALRAPGAGARGVAALASVAIIAAIVFTGSRGSLVALVGVLVVGAIVYRVFFRAVIACVVAVAIALPALPTGYVERLASVFEMAGSVANRDEDGGVDVSLAGRLDEQRVAVAMLVDSPMVGVGEGNYEHLFQRYTARMGLTDRFEPRQPHNLLLEVAAETGLAGLLAYGGLLAAVVVWLVRAGRGFREAGRPDFASVTMAFGLSLLAYQLSSIFLHEAWPRPWWLLVGVAGAAPGLARGLTGTLSKAEYAR